MRLPRASTLSAVVLLLAGAAPGQTPAPIDLTQASLEDLMNITVTSVSRKEQKLSQTAAAVFVITQDDIRRSGATNIPDVLRMAPGVNVARIDANTWAISIRGFNARYSDKILVLIDGRSENSPSFSGVYWDQIHVPLEDIERIEVIRGPGGTVWGADAVNGVINIITMGSKATQGGLIVAEAGSQESGGLAQYGGKAGGAGTWRAFGTYSNTDSSVDPSGVAAADGWHAFNGGFRTDLQPSSRDTVMVQGDLYKTGEGQTLTTVLSGDPPVAASFNNAIAVANGDLQTQWNHTLQSGSEVSLNVYYSHVNRLDQALRETTDTFNIDFQHHLSVNSRNDVVWGWGYRVTGDTMNAGYNDVFLPPRRTQSLYSAFVQDEIKFAESAWFTIGTKLENNAFTGFEYEPSAQFTWTPTGRQTIWLSVSQAVRQPSRQNTDLEYDVAVVPLQGGLSGVETLIGNPDIQSEKLRDYEAGYRSQITKRLSLEVTAFRSYYRELQTLGAGTPFPADTASFPYLVIPLDVGNGARAATYGGEAFAVWSITGRWRISTGYSLLHMQIFVNPSELTADNSGDTPKHQIQFRSSLGLRSNLDWDTSIYYVGQLSANQIPGYVRLDTQLRWRIGKFIEAGITGQNLLTARHPEFVDALTVNYTEVQRTIGGRITWRF